MPDLQPPEAKCVKCGACTSVCPVYRITGKEALTARGRIHLVANPPAKRSPAYREIFFQCLLCGACEDVCSRGIGIRDIITGVREETAGPGGRSSLRKRLLRKTLSSPALLRGLGRAGKFLAGLPEESGLLQKLAGFPPDLPSLDQPSPPPAGSRATASDLNYFSGCLAGYLAPDIQTATVDLLRRTGNGDCRINEGQSCCGLGSHTSGAGEQARRTAIRNIEAFENSDGPILTSCSSCYSHLKKYPDILSGDPVWRGKAERFSERLREFSSFMAGKIPEDMKAGGTNDIRVAIHDPCHFRFGGEKIIEAPRRLVRESGDFLLREIPGQCCGQGGLFQMDYPELSERIADRRIQDVSAASPDYLLTTCSGCLLQLNRAAAGSGLPVRAYHLAVFINHFL